MKNKILFTLLCVFSSVSFNVWAVNVGEKAPDFNLTTLAGDSVKLNDYVGKTPVHLIFWATWCAACLKEVPQIKILNREFAQRLPTLAINIGISDSIEKSKAYKSKHEIPYPIAFDSNNAVSKAFGVVATPTQIIIGRDGTVYYRGVKTPSVADINTNWKDLTQP